MLKHYKIRGLAHKWTESHLIVSVTATYSVTKDMMFGVRQGRILGPLIYISDIPEAAAFAKFIMYADDANTIRTADTIEMINS